MKVLGQWQIRNGKPKIKNKKSMKKESIELSAKDKEILAKAIAKSQQPNEALKKAASTKQQTAMQEAIEEAKKQRDQFERGSERWIGAQAIITVLSLEWASGKERQQIVDSFDEGNPNGFIDKTGEQYYNETYGQ